MTMNSADIGRLVDLVDRADVRKIERRRRFGFRDESRSRLVVRAKMRRQKLDGHDAVEFHVERAIHHAHAARPPAGRGSCSAKSSCLEMIMGAWSGRACTFRTPSVGRAESPDSARSTWRRPKFAFGDERRRWGRQRRSRKEFRAVDRRHVVVPRVEQIERFGDESSRPFCSANVLGHANAQLIERRPVLGETRRRRPDDQSSGHRH